MKDAEPRHPEDLSALADDFRTFLQDAPAVLNYRFSDLAFVQEREDLNLPTLALRIDRLEENP
jgi:hypothetical protein